MHKTNKLAPLHPLLALLLSLASLSILTGCETYGSRAVSVNLKTVPPTIPAHAFLVPIERWAEITSTLSLTQPYCPVNPKWFREQLEHYRPIAKRTPVTVTALPYRTMYVVESGGTYWWTIIKPEPNKDFTIYLDK
jgi:hypothetical protein